MPVSVCNVTWRPGKPFYLSVVDATAVRQYRVILRNRKKNYQPQFLKGMVGWPLEGAIEILKKNLYFFFAPIRKAHEYFLNLRREHSTIKMKHAPALPKLGLL